MMKFELKAISLWPFIKVAVLVNTALGFILGIFYALFLGVIISIASSVSGPLADELSNPDLPTGMLVVILPIFFAILGGVLYTMIGVIFVLFYNLAASLAGGFEFEMKPVAELTPVPPQQQPPSYYSSYPGYSAPTASTMAPPPPPPSQQPPTPPPTKGFE